MSRITLRLTLDVTYEIDATELNVQDQISDLETNLRDLGTRAANGYWLTGDTDATVVICSPRVEELR